MQACSDPNPKPTFVYKLYGEGHGTTFKCLLLNKNNRQLQLIEMMKRTEKAPFLFLYAIQEKQIILRNEMRSII